MFFRVRRDPKAGSVAFEAFVSRVSRLIKGIKRTERVLSEIISFEMSLKQTAHLRITRSRMVEDEEVKFEREGVDEERDND